MSAIVVNIQSKSSCSGVSLKIFREPAVEITPAGEEAAPKSRPWKIFGRGNQNTSKLSGLQLGPTATSVEDDYAIVRKLIEGTPTPKEPSEWVSNLIDGVDTVKSMIDVVKDVSRFLVIDFYVLTERCQVHPAAAIAWSFISTCINVRSYWPCQNKRLADSTSPDRF